MNLLESLKKLPFSSGVYQYFDEEGKLLYVGKAKVLKNRVKSYFNFTPNLRPADKLSPRIFKMVSEVKDLKIIVTDSEQDALILENSLIKQLKPKYNILLRDDKTYPYIYIRNDDDYPRFEITRKVVRGKNIKYFGPFVRGGSDILKSLYELFPLVQKKNCIKGKQACLFHQIEKCKAPCEEKISKDEYREIVEVATSYINNKQKILKELENKMVYYSENLNFEEAGEIRDRIVSIKESVVDSSIDLASIENFDVIAIGVSEKRACSVRMFIRGGKVISSTHNFFKFDFGFEKEEAYERSFYASYSADVPLVANKIYLYEDIEDKETITKWLSDKFGKEFQLVVPQKGAKRKIVDLAFKNANELLKMEKGKENTEDLIKEFFGFLRSPNRAEVFDNSHLGGKYTVGAMVVHEDEKFVRSDYRHYNLEAKDEYGQMKEVLIRRANRFEENPPPDVWVIDGGKALVDLAKSVLESVGVNIDVIGVAKEKIDAKAHRAKGSAKDLLYFNDEVYKLSTNDKKLHFFQKLRDEAHRVAITHHRKARTKGDLNVKLTDVEGIGEATVKRLIDYFGTFENIQKASFEDLNLIIDKKKSENIIIYFNKTSVNKINDIIYQK
ncbi:MAG: excinuclease ABC subunit UvrC [Campylobacterales bacterium]|nr:excinuclease ABC subunit UvrC [Campylobacterales bacterium]